jgi:hypothetical protein
MIAGAAVNPDGNWVVELSLTGWFGFTTVAHCPAFVEVPVVFTNGSSEGPSGNLRMTPEGDVEGWLALQKAGVPHDLIVRLSGRLHQGVADGTASGRCSGHFKMSRR